MLNPSSTASLIMRALTQYLCFPASFPNPVPESSSPAGGYRGFSGNFALTYRKPYSYTFSKNKKKWGLTKNQA